MSSNQQYKRDLSLLRDFDLEVAKNGALLATVILEDGKFDYPAHKDCFKMAPLAWLHGKPIYKGDVVYGTWSQANPEGYVVQQICTNSHGDKYLSHGDEGSRNCLQYLKDIDSFLTWSKPKQKKSFWINVYPNLPDDVLTCVWSSKEKADCHAGSERIACVEVQYEV